MEPGDRRFAVPEIEQKGGLLNELGEASAIVF
jgi:hypothetical protein